MAIRGQAGQDLVWEQGHDYPLEGALQALDRPDFQVYEAGAARGRTVLGTAGRACPDADDPGRTVVRDNSGC
ncbi:hypothetical protein ACFVUH_16700 [Kitasatospora sp. NPDC058032]|uniref:hypothetical protein n=1 Tax=Kitasatospora sp. NPDC058032 TaxID=3346307 RepID=UPI0036DF7598